MGLHLLCVLDEGSGFRGRGSPGRDTQAYAARETGHRHREDPRDCAPCRCSGPATLRTAPAAREETRLLSDLRTDWRVGLPSPERTASPQAHRSSCPGFPNKRSLFRERRFRVANALWFPAAAPSTRGPLTICGRLEGGV